MPHRQMNAFTMTCQCPWVIVTSRFRIFAQIEIHWYTSHCIDHYASIGNGEWCGHCTGWVSTALVHHCMVCLKDYQNKRSQLTYFLDIWWYLILMNHHSTKQNVCTTRQERKLRNTLIIRCELTHIHASQALQKWEFPDLRCMQKMTTRS